MRTPRQGPINLIDGCLERNSVDIPLGIANAYIGVVAQFRLSSYLVWVGVKFSNAKEEELLVNDTSQIGSKKFDFSIE